MAAVLSCGPDAVVSHHDAGALWKIRPYRGPLIHLSVPHCCRSRGPGLKVHRRRTLGSEDLTRRNGIPVTTPICTLIDMAPDLTERQLERAINEADMLGLVRPEPLRAALDGRRRPGAGKLAKLLDRHMFVLTESELEQAFLPLVNAAGLPPPQTGRVVNRFKVDFFWPDLRLVVETDSWTHHRTPAQKDRDSRRDHAHFAAELIPLRFTHGQIAHDPEHVIATLRRVARRAGH